MKGENEMSYILKTNQLTKSFEGKEVVLLVESSILQTF
ncbi:ABC transporter ATP-binding protein [Bacillus mycoides]|nr:ABC transporter ATP-binding protein [Bacillus mycoides]